jgi:RimJ/RimL family protein N-acetyltransferase
MALANIKLVGARLFLRQVCLADATENYARWMNDPEINCYLESRFVTHTVAGLRQYIEKTNADPHNFFLAIMLQADDRHIGNIKLGPVNPVHRLGDIGLIIGETDCWGKGYATEAIELITRFAFHELKLHKVTASCYANNPGSARAFQKAGFTIEAVRPAHFFCAGRFVDAILLGRINPTQSD